MLAKLEVLKLTTLFPSLSFKGAALINTHSRLGSCSGFSSELFVGTTLSLSLVGSGEGSPD